MNKTIMAAIRAHALEESSRECCGFVIQSGRRQRYIPVPNTHEIRQNIFASTASTGLTPKI
ncbi:Mov34/MPN/PAD-1 family protein [Enterobacter hormaechei]